MSACQSGKERIWISDDMYCKEIEMKTGEILNAYL